MAIELVGRLAEHARPTRIDRARPMHRAAPMGLVADVRRNAPFIGIMLAIAITWLALVLAVVALLLRM